MTVVHGSVRGGLVFAARYLSYILLAFAGILTYVYVFAWMSLGTNDVVTLSSLIVAVIPSMSLFLLLTFVGFLAGYCPEGTRDRLYIRFMMDAFKLLCIFYVSHSVEYAVGMVVLDQEYGTYIADASVYLDVTHIAFILALLPLLSMADAVLEYRQNRDRYGGPRRDTPGTEE